MTKPYFGNNSYFQTITQHPTKYAVWFFVVLFLALLVTGGKIEATRQATVNREIAITIDDLPVNHMTKRGLEGWQKVTSRLLKSLKKHGVPAIGFVNIGKLYEEEERLDKRRLALLKMWLDAGFELGNHSFSHLDLHKTPLPEFTQDIQHHEDILRDLCEEHNRELKFFRHPLLHTGLDLETKHHLEQFLTDHSYRVAPVTMDNSEWIYARAFDIATDREDTELKQRIAAAYLDYMDRIFAYYESQSRALFDREIKQILLIHSNTLNSEYFGDLARLLKKRGYTFISLDEALQDKAYASEDRYTGPGGITWLHRWALTQGKRGDFFKGEPEVDEFINSIYQGKY
ncbi:polysaccharide deacetylase family protein [Acidobacteriota bacterium]